MIEGLSLVAACKIAALALFVPLYLGALGYAYWKPNKARFEAYARIPLSED